MRLRCALALCLAVPLNEAVNVDQSSFVALRAEAAADAEADAAAISEAGASFGMRVATKAEIMATMTLDKAMRTFLHLSKSRPNASAIAIEFVKRRMGERKHLRQRHGQSVLKGYAALEPARKLLNDMMNEAIMKKELETVKCDEFQRKQIKILDELQTEVSMSTSGSAGSRSDLLKSQQMIAVLEEVKLPSARDALAQHAGRCKGDIAALKMQLQIVTADVEVMKRAVGMVTCKSDGSADVSSQVALLQCPTSCQDTVIFVNHADVHDMLSKVQSQVAQQYIQQELSEQFDADAEAGPDDVQPMSLLQSEVGRQPAIKMPGESFAPPVMASAEKCNERMTGDAASGYRGCQAKTLNGRTCQKWTEQTPHAHNITAKAYPKAGLGDHNRCRNPDGKQTIWCYTTDPLKPWEYCSPIIDLPSTKVSYECVAKNECKIGPGNCKQLRDRFLLILAGVIDKRDQLTSDLDKAEDNCQKVQKTYETGIATMESQLSEQQTALATATRAMVEAQQAAEQSAKQHKDLESEYKKELRTCCDNKNSFTSEVCALEQIRGELYKMQGLEMYITDCQVSEWADEQCSKSCGGGQQIRNRRIVMQSVNGTECPPLRMERTCNIDPCPVACKVSAWSEWTSCSSECDGGIMTRERQRLQEPKNGGDPCPEESETVTCNVGACNAPCELAEWEEWGPCSKACDTGRKERIRPVKIKAKGLGSCPRWKSNRRLQFRRCNTRPCQELLQPGNVTLRCGSAVDLIVLLDGSGSLGRYGWKQSKDMAIKFIQSMKGSGKDGVNMALLLFSGPLTANTLDACTSSRAGVMPDVEKDCGIKWLSRFTKDIAKVEESARKATWPAGTTLTSMALAEARAELSNGRPGANSVVVVITDGKPMSDIKTSQAAKALSKDSRLVWVPVGRAIQASMKNIRRWASRPWQDNVVTIPDFSMLALPTMINRLVATTCPKVL